MEDAIRKREADVESYVWKMAKGKDGDQEEVRLMDATPEQLKRFHAHCNRMLYNDDARMPGRYVLLRIIDEQRRKCNVELFMRKLEDGSITPDQKPFPRFMYIQQVREFMANNRELFPVDEQKSMHISTCTGGLPREFEGITIDEALNGGLDMLGYFDNRHITFNFILGMGVFLTQDEMRELSDSNPDKRKIPELIKERLRIPKNVVLAIKPSGLSFKELRAMLTLKSRKYSEMTTDQLVVLRNKVLFKFENEVSKHIDQWEARKAQIKAVADRRGLRLAGINCDADEECDRAGKAHEEDLPGHQPAGDAGCGTKDEEQEAQDV